MATTLNLTEVITVFFVQLAGIVVALIAQRKKVKEVETEVEKSEEEIVKTREELHDEVISLRAQIVKNELETSNIRRQLDSMETKYAKTIFANELKTRQIAELHDQIEGLNTKLENVMIRRTKNVKVPIDRRKIKP